MAKREPINEQIGQIFDYLLDETTAILSTASDNASKEAVKALRKKKFKRTSVTGYSKGWNRKKWSSGRYTVYNKTHPWLAHLLENGHVLVAHGETVGYYEGEPHIRPVAEKIAKDMEKYVTDELNKRL